MQAPTRSADRTSTAHSTTSQGTAQLLGGQRSGPTVSFELYPPRTDKGADTVRQAITELAPAEPDFFSVTYGAAGKTRDSSRELVRHVRAETDITAVAHLTCVGASAQELRGVIDDLLDEGVRDFLALRGDPPAGQPEWRPHPQGLRRASELVRLLRTMEAERLGSPGWERAGIGPHPLSISVAAYPGTARDRRGNVRIDPRDVEALVEKQEAGADFAITQIFYDAAHYAALVEQARRAGVHIPIVAGVIPLTDPRRLRKLHGLTGVEPPEGLLAELEGAGSRGEAYRIGQEATRSLVGDILQAGAPGLHIYTFNTATPALDLLRGARLRPVPSAA